MSRLSEMYPITWKLPWVLEAVYRQCATEADSGGEALDRLLFRD